MPNNTETGHVDGSRPRHAHKAIRDALIFGLSDEDIQQYVVDAVDFARLTVRDGIAIQVPIGISLKPAQEALRKFHKIFDKLEKRGLLY